MRQQTRSVALLATTASVHLAVMISQRANVVTKVGHGTSDFRIVEVWKVPQVCAKARFCGSTVHSFQ